MKHVAAIISGGILVAATLIASASSPFDIEFPIAELGGCADKAACATFCDNPANAVACAEFAVKHGLGDRRSVEAAKTIQGGGPGGCTSEESCHAYCEDPAHETECIEFAVSKGFMTRAEADRALKPGPGGCRGRACQAYCEDAAHEDECFAYAVDNGFIPKEEAERIREFKKKFSQTRSGPGGCRGEQDCRTYCDNPDHIDECLEFAEEHGFVDKEHAKVIKKTHGRGPGGCKGAEECREFCDNPNNQPACIDFAAENGFMSREEAERARKFAGKTGPGGCRGEQCRDFCNQSGNEDACLEFAEREGILPPQELERAKKFLNASRQGGPGGCRGQACRQYCGDPAHQEECFSFAKGNGLISKEEEAQFETGIKIQQVVAASGGPGGCKRDDECREYCTEPSHVEECIAFGATHGGVPPEQAREMLKQFTNRRFEVHGGVGRFGPPRPEDLDRFQREAEQRFEEFRALEHEFRGKFPGGGFPGEPPGAFPGAPGQFPGQPGKFPPSGGFPQGGPGGAAFVGPGGCTSPTECISYCASHKEECFGGPPSGSFSGEQGRGPRGSESDFGFRGGPPQLRSNLIQEFKPEELPEGFHNLSPEERQQFFHDKFPEFNPPQPGQFPGGRGGPSGGGFPGRPPEGFPGRPGEFPGRPPQGFPGRPEEFPGGREGSHPPEGFSPERIQELQQLQQQFQQPSPELQQRLPEIQRVPAPSSGGISPESGTFHPPEGSFIQPPTGTFTAPSEGSFTQPPPSGSFPPPSGSFESQPPPPPSGEFTPPPSSQLPLIKFFGAIVEGFLR